MSVILHSPVMGKQVGETYTGPNEQWLVENGYAKKSSGTFNGVYTGAQFNDADRPADEAYEATSSTDGYVPEIDPSTVTNGDQPVRNYQPQTYGPANPSTDGHLPTPVDPMVNPHA